MKTTKGSKKFLQITIGSILFLLTLYFAFNAYLGVTYAVELEAKCSGITIDQTDLFNITNLYPGQPPSESKQPLKIKNTGNSDFQSSITSKLTSGDQKLFDVLKLNILDDKGVAVYSGSLGGLTGQSLGTIGPRASKTLGFTLELPADVDNSYQNLSTSFQFTIAASGGSGDDGDDGDDGDNGDDESNGGNENNENNENNAPPPSEEPEEVIVPDKEDVLAPVETENPQMPNTGIPSRLPYYLVGSMAVFSGLLLGFKKL